MTVSPLSIPVHLRDLAILLLTGAVCVTIIACFSKHVTLYNETMNDTQRTMFYDDSLRSSGLAGRFAIGSYRHSPNDKDDDEECDHDASPKKLCDCVRPPLKLARCDFVSTDNLNVFRKSHPKMAKKLEEHGLEAIWDHDYAKFYRTEACVRYMATLF